MQNLRILYFLCITMVGSGRGNCVWYFYNSLEKWLVQFFRKVAKPNINVIKFSAFFTSTSCKISEIRYFLCITMVGSDRGNCVWYSCNNLDKWLVPFFRKVAKPHFSKFSAFFTSTSCKISDILYFLCITMVGIGSGRGNCMWYFYKSLDKWLVQFFRKVAKPKFYKIFSIFHQYFMHNLRNLIFPVHNNGWKW